MTKKSRLSRTISKRSRKAVLLASAAVAVTAVAAPATAVAQDEEAASGDRIVVTGSRLKRAGVDTVYPALSVDAEEFDKRAFTNVADALNELPSFGENAQTSAGNQANGLVGQNYVDFLNLGSQRTLTLVNGRRFVSSNPPGGAGAGSGLQVDLNILPIALIDRVETIGIGGAPIYGSDAIAGTVNVILKDDYEGLDILGQYGVTEKGDADEYRLQFVSGGNFAEGRGNVTVSAEYTKQQGLHLSGRPLYTTNDPYYARDLLVEGDGVFRLGYNQQIDTFTSGGIASDENRVRATFGQGALADGVIYRFAPNGELVPFVVGGLSPDNSPVWAQGGDGFDLLDAAGQIISPLERMVFSGNARYDLNDSVRMFVDFQFANTKATELANQDGFQAGTGPGGEYGPLVFSVDNPFLSAQARDILTDNGLSEFFLHRYHSDIYNTQWESESFVWRAAAGLTGDFDLGDKPFTWEASLVHGESTFLQGGTMIIDGRFLNAIDVVELTQTDIDAVLPGRSILTYSGTPTANVGDIVCRAALQAAQGVITGDTGSGVTDRHLPFVTGCVPLNLFGENAASPEAIDWVTGTEDSESKIEQTVYNINVGGELFDLPAGAMLMNVGFEARKEAASYTPEVALEIALGRHEPVKPTSGSFNTKEFFAETLIPLVNPDMEFPLLNFAEATAAYRRIDNSVTGKANVWTAGARISFFPDVVIRGNYTHSIRAPSLGELYAPIATVFSQAQDPCSFLFSDQGTANRIPNCASDIAGYDPDSFTSLVTSTSRLGRTGGNPNLENEKADSWTVGATIEPSIIPNLLLTVDYIKIDIEDAITSLNLTQIMRACYDAPTPTSSNPACSQFTRDSDGEIVDFLTGQTNAQIFNHASLTYRAAYGFDVANVFGANADYGGIDFNFNLHHTLKRNTSVVGEMPQPTVGSFTVPRMSATFDTTWRRNNLRLFWRTLWRPAATIDLTGTRTYEDADGDVITKAGGLLLHNASISYALDDIFPGGPKSTAIQLSVNNVFDSKPDTEELALGYFTLAQQLGRSFSIRLRGSF